MLLTLMGIYFLLCFVFPSLRIYKMTGKNPISFKGADNAHDLIGFYMKIVIGLCAVAGFDQWHPSFFNFYLFIDSPALPPYGYALIVISMLWTMVAQWQMSSSWRIGIDTENETELRVHGLYRYSRNPIFLGMLGLVLGIFIVRPIFLNLLTFVLSVILMTIQIRLEEEFLDQQHGDDFFLYKSQTRRWI